MKQQFRILAFMIAIVAIGFQMAAEGLSYLKITTKTGDAVYVALAEKPQVSVTEEGVAVATASENLTFLFSAEPRFECSEESAVKTVDAEASVLFRYADGVISVCNLPANSDIIIADIQGRTILTGKTDSRGAWNTTVSSLAPAVYIIHTAKTTSKIIVK